MIAKLTGRLDETGADWAVIDVRGVGYLVHCSSKTLAALGIAGDECTVFTHLQVSGAAKRDRGGDQAGPRARRGDVGSAAERRPLREPGAPPGDSRGDDAAEVLAVRRAFERGGRDDPRDVRARGEGGRDYLANETVWTALHGAPSKTRVIP